MTSLFLSIAILAFCPHAATDTDDAAHCNLMPIPAKVEFIEGELTIDGSLRIELPDGADSRLQRAAARLFDRLTQQTGLLFIPDTMESRVRAPCSVLRSRPHRAWCLPLMRMSRTA